MSLKTRKVDLESEFPWATTGDARALVKALGEDKVRFVGGAVRDSLIGKDVIDIDMATTHPPEKAMNILRKAGIKVLPTGLKHGTVTAVFPERHFEVTTLRHDVETFGRHAEVEFHDDWEADAARRDFTLNALYLSPKAKLFDYFEGEADLLAGRVRFIGSPEKRIEEDALRILRLFRFHAWYGKGKVDREGLKAVSGKLDMLQLLSPERIRDETLKLLRAPDPVPVLETMKKSGVLEAVFGKYSFDFERLSRVIALEDALTRTSGLRRLGALLKIGPDDAEKLYHRFHLSKAERKRLASMTAEKLPARLDAKTIRRMIYGLGLKTFQDVLILNYRDKQKALAAVEFSEKTKIPRFPVRGRDLEKKGVKPGKGMGKILKNLEQRWVQSDFSLSKKQLLED